MGGGMRIMSATKFDAISITKTIIVTIIILDYSKPDIVVFEKESRS